MPPEDWLREMTDAELESVVAELEERAEMFDAKVRQQVNDELRRRQKKTLKEKRW